MQDFKNFILIKVLNPDSDKNVKEQTINNRN